MPVPVIVLNFGHSVLNSLEDYTQAASEIYRHYRQGQNVVAVTSAQGDQTDVLMAEARRIGPEGDAKNLPELLQLGERRSAALLALALERIGAPAFVRQARDLGLTAEGSFTEARLTGLNTPQLLQDLKDHDIVVMPGFVAIGEKDRAVLLGDGGADLTALYVADQLGVEAVLLKDVNGIYEVDPKSNPNAARYEEISWGDATRVAGPLIAPRALGFARKHEVPFRVGTPGLPSYTHVGAKTGHMKSAPSPQKLRIAMMGLGVVGGGVFRRVAAHTDQFEIVKVMVRSLWRNRACAWSFQSYVGRRRPCCLGEQTSHRGGRPRATRFCGGSRRAIAVLLCGRRRHACAGNVLARKGPYHSCAGASERNNELYARRNRQRQKLCRGVKRRAR